MDSLSNKFGFITGPKGRFKLLSGVIIIVSIVVIVLLAPKLFVWEYEWLNVHLIPHSHDDVGWLDTPEDYYRHGVKYILDHVIIELSRKKSRKFVYAETYFFWKWWQEQSGFVRKIVRDLIRNKQLEIIGGGWCMSDEAVTHYQSFIDQSTWGFRRLNDTFGQIACPTIGWQIDTFGHSKGIASLLAQMGFTGLFFARIDMNERKYRKRNKLMEFVWTGNEDLGDSSSIFTSVFYNHYSPPPGFDFELVPLQTEINYAAFSSYVHNQAKFFKTNHILVPMGDDFRFFNARVCFLKMDKLISFFRKNAEFKLNVFYSTPSEYVKSLQRMNIKWPHQKKDFFPYATGNHGYWTGFYTSRPTFKYFARISNNVLQITKQLLVFANIGGDYSDELTSLREAVGVAQHHDAITGTSQQHVANHYVKLLHDGITNCEIPLNDALGKLSMPDQEYISGPMFESCLLLNISSCPPTEKYSRFVVSVYNPLSRPVSHYVRLPVTGDQYSVLTSEGTEVESQMVAISKWVRRIPGRTSTAKLELVFKVANVPPMGFKSFYVFLDQRKRNPRKNQKGIRKKRLKPMFDLKTGTMFKIKLKNESYALNQGISFYKSSKKWSGAYLFTPEYKNTFSPGSDDVQTKLLNNGDLVKEYEQTFSDWASQIVRIYRDEDHVEFEWLVGPIPVSDFVGKEVILTYQSDIESGNVFYTDVNGMGMEKRTKESMRWKEKIYEEAAGNYYPVTTMISIKDDSSQMFVINDRAQGGSSLQSGQIELMVHRRLCYDDAKGVAEPLDETAYGCGLVARGRHWLLIGKKDLAFEQKAKLFAQSKHSEPWLFFLDASSLSFEEWRSKYVTEFSGLYSYLPRNVRVLTLEPWKEDTILLRLENVFERVGGSQLVDESVAVDLPNLFKKFEIIEAKETSLGADRWISDMKRLNWRTDVPRETFEKGIQMLPCDNLTVYLAPQEIRTFIDWTKVTIIEGTKRNIPEEWSNAIENVLPGVSVLFTKTPHNASIMLRSGDCADQGECFIIF